MIILHTKTLFFFLVKIPKLFKLQELYHDHFFKYKIKLTNTQDTSILRIAQVIMLMKNFFTHKQNSNHHLKLILNEKLL